MKLTKQSIITGVILLGLLFVVGWFIANFNGLVRKQAGVDNAWAKVETQYQRRLDLIDNIVSSVQGAQGQEREVFGRIADSRRQYAQAESTEEKVAAASSIESNVALLPRLQEAYPELKSNTQVTTLISQLSGTEDQIASARDGYNDAVTRYNLSVSSFPGSIFASMFDFERAKLFKSASGASTAPQVDFGFEEPSR